MFSQESKVCANHHIGTHMKLEPVQSTDRFWVWCAIDDSDGMPHRQQFAVKFKTSEQAREFKRQLEELQDARKLEEKEQIECIVRQI